MRKNHGFTVIELCVVIAVIAILAAVGTPSVLEWRANAKLRGAVNNLKADFELARLRAIRENRFVAVTLTANGYQVFIDDSPSNWTFDGGEERFRNIELPTGVGIDLVATTFTGDCTRFNGRGIPGNTGTCVVSDFRGQTRNIIVNRVGHVRVQ